MQASARTDPQGEDLNNDTIILSVPVLAVPRTLDQLPQSGNDDDNPIKESKRRFSLFKRKPSMSKEKKSSNDESAPVMKDMTRTEYLKHYALDGYGKYIGTEDPAPDCVLKDASDIAKYKMPPEYRAMLGDTATRGMRSPLVAGVNMSMGMGMFGAGPGGF